MSSRRCPDDGYCHHGCPDGECFRVRACAPLSSYGEDWRPEDVERLGGPPAKPTVEDVLVSQGEAGSAKAFRGEWNYTFVAADLEDASRKWGVLDDVAQRLGLNGEGGSVDLMADDELLDGSPTDRDLRAARAPQASVVEGEK